MREDLQSPYNNHPQHTVSTIPAALDSAAITGDFWVWKGHADI